MKKAWWDDYYLKQASAMKEPSSWLISHKDLIKSGAVVLDIACGAGRNAVALALAGFKVRALDFSAEALRLAEQLAREAALSVGPLTSSQLEFKAIDLDLYLPELMSFDALVSIDFKLPKTLFSNASRGLKQNGLFFIEASLMERAREQKVEAFECFQPNELLKLFLAVASSYRLLHYSETELPGKVTLIAQKTQLM